MSKLNARLFLLLQFLLPRYWLTRIVYRVTRVRLRAVKNALIGGFVRGFGVDLGEAARAVPDGYRSFNDFFTRELREGARPIDAAAASIVAPADGSLSAIGTIEAGRILQAKGLDYTLDELLAVNIDEAERFAGGAFATIYLAPYDYHRVHAPAGGTLQSLCYVPGELFSVNASTVSLLPSLFVRNERLICRFDTAAGPMAVILVGALNVGSMTTRWSGEIRPRRHGAVEFLRPDPEISRQVEKGDLLGWFNMGSTVIVLYPPGKVTWREQLAAGARVKMGQAIGDLSGTGRP